MTTAAVRKIALNALRIAPENARKTAASAASHDELKASIRAHGVMQNLSAYDGKDGFFYIYAGGRRLTALQDLAAEGAIEADARIGCVVKDAKDAAELSLVENVMRAAMHPADEFEAFAALIDQGKTEDAVAERFGTTVLHVRKRMKLAALAPQLLALYREGRINQEALMAFTLSDKLPLAKEIAGFDFATTPINEGLVKELATGAFLAHQRNAVLVGGTGTGKTHLAIAIGRACVRTGARVRFYNTVDLVNRLEAEPRRLSTAAWPV